LIIDNYKEHSNKKAIGTGKSWQILR